MSKQPHQHSAQRAVQARAVKMSPKVVFWVVFSASMLALVSFSLMFVMAAYRNGWW